MSRKGENIYKRKDGRWEARYIKEHRINGRIHYGYCYGKTYHEARDKVNQARYALMNDQLLPVRGKRNRFADYCNEWLYLKLINKKRQLKSSVIIDELPTIYFKGLDNLIATARSNKVAVCLGFQDFSQLVRDYGDKEAKVVINTVGNIFSGQVVGETAKTLSERFGKVLQKRQSISINRQDVSTSINTQMDSLIPPSKISGLTQGMFVGSVSDNFNERIEQKIFHAEIVVDTEKVKREESNYKPIPIINDFKDADGNDCMKQAIQDNYNRIKEDVKQIVKDELERIAGDENLKHLIQK